MGTLRTLMIGLHGVLPCISTTVILALPLGSAAAEPAPTPGPGPATASIGADVNDLASLGWTAEPAPPLPCAVRQPVLEAQMAVWLSLNRPNELPQPRFACPDGDVVIPIAQDPALLQRVEGPKVHAEWKVRASGHARGAAAALAVDIEPFDTVPAARTTGVTLGPGIGGTPMAMVPRPILDPALRGRASKFNRVPEPVATPRSPEVVASLVVEGLSDDALVATVDGKAWLRLQLGGEQPRMRWLLGPERVFAGATRLLVAPRAIHADSETLLLAIDPASLAVTSLGRPAPPDAGRWLRVTDARERAGLVEALVVVDQLDKTGLSSPWGLLARLQDGRWSFPEHFFTPAAQGTLPDLRFDGSDPAVIRLEAGDTRAWRKLVPAAPAPAP